VTAEAQRTGWHGFDKGQEAMALGRGKETGEGKVSNTWVSASQMMLDQKKD
jgi:hypothetical protein